MQHVGQGRQFAKFFHPNESSNLNVIARGFPVIFDRKQEQKKLVLLIQYPAPIKLSFPSSDITRKSFMGCDVKRRRHVHSGGPLTFKSLYPRDRRAICYVRSCSFLQGVYIRRWILQCFLWFRGRSLLV
jgi:hypothetical protein